jgi:HEAT repeat protein
MACHALGQIGPAAKEAVPALTAALQDNDQNVRQFAQNALQQIQPKEKKEDKNGKGKGK